MFLKGAFYNPGVGKRSTRNLYSTEIKDGSMGDSGKYKEFFFILKNLYFFITGNPDKFEGGFYLIQFICKRLHKLESDQPWLKNVLDNEK